MQSDVKTGNYLGMRGFLRPFFLQHHFSTTKNSTTPKRKLFPENLKNLHKKSGKLASYSGCLISGPKTLNFPPKSRRIDPPLSKFGCAREKHLLLRREIGVLPHVTISPRFPPEVGCIMTKLLGEARSAATGIELGRGGGVMR